jgi:ELWxxDGT repeat protein
VRRKLRVPCLALGLLAVLLPGGKVAHAQLAHLVKDLNTTTPMISGISYMPTPVSAGATVFFTDNDGRTGDELWKLDTATGTATLVKDICPGPCSSSPLWLTALGNLVFFQANDGVHGAELWRTDGTEAGTFLLRDINPGFAAGYGGPWIDAVGGKILFSGRDPIYGVELWSTDGTRAGTQRIAQVSPGIYGEIDPLASSGTRLLFVASDGVHGPEPWISDGTTAGTYQIRDLNPGAATSFPYNVRARTYASALPDGNFVFAADDGTHGAELWRTDGTDAGTVLVQDVYTGATASYPEGFVALGGKVYFTATASGGWGLWSTDGTSAGTALVLNIAAGPPNFTKPPMTLAGNRLYFASGLFGTLLSSDGTSAGTQSLGVDYALEISGLGNSAMVLAGGISGQLALWKTDGTQANTVQVKALGATSCAGYYFPPSAEVDGELYFHQCLSLLTGGPLWKTDGTQAGTVQVQAPAGTASFRSTYSPGLDNFLSPLGSGLFFNADDGVSGPRVWHTDGSAAGTQPVTSTASADSIPRPVPLGSSLIYVSGGAWRMDADGSATDLGVSGASDFPVTAAGSQVFFAVYDGSGNYGIWKTDGTAAGTAAVPGTTHPGTPSFRGVAGSALLFSVGSGETWRTDGTGPGTFQLTSSPPIFGPTATIGNDLYFPAFDTGFWALWKTDGTTAGTVVVKTFSESPTALSNGPDKMTPAGGRLFFTLGDTSHGEELWVTDGTDAGTHLVKDILPGPGSSGIGVPPLPLNGLLYFTADDGVHGYELWVSDGTDAGTHLVKDIAPGARSAGIYYLVAAGGRLFLTADDGVHGIELWTSDSTDAGTHLVKDILPGADSSLPFNLTPVGRHVVFNATDGVHGSEPWVSDGTDAGTFLLQDVAPGAVSSGPLGYAAGATKAFFVADDSATGAELWTVPRRALDPTFTDVPSTYWAWRFIESLAASGVTGGCGGGDFCPGDYVNRAQMAVFVLAARGTVPPPATGTRFNDVPLGYWAGPWIEELAREGVVSGCAANLYCPGNLLTRAEMAVLLTVSRHENPPPATGTRFADVPAGYWAARFIEQLAADGVTSGCGGGNFCPDQPVTRGEMAVFLATAFHLPLP